MVSWLVIGAVLALSAIIIQYILDQLYLDTTGQYVLITGCDTGFGNILATSLGRKRGCHVIAACLTEAGVKAVLTAAPKGTVTALRMDVTDSDSIQQAYDRVAGLVGDKGLWGLVNNAGVTGCPVPYHWLTKQEIQRILDINLMGVIEVTNTFFPLIRKAKGRIVNVSSSMALVPLMAGGYEISKVGVEAFSDVMRKSSQPFGVSVHILEPGYFKTNVTSLDNILPKAHEIWNRLSQQERDIYGKTYFDTLITKASAVLESSSASLHLVTDAMEHALCAWWPWRRYLPGLDVKFFFKPLSLLPDWVADKVLLSVYNVKPAITSPLS